ARESTWVEQLDFRVLGPLEVCAGNQVLALGGLQQRALLALLVLRANELVPTDELVDALWGESPPATATTTVQVYVSRLRKTLGAEQIATRSPGYVLHAEPEQVDLARFERLAAAARAASDPHETVALFDQALALWRGRPLGEFVYERFARTEIERLEELRLAAVE